MKDAPREAEGDSVTSTRPGRRGVAVQLNHNLDDETSSCN